MGDSNAITVIANILASIVLVILFYLKYKKLQQKPKLWKIVLIVFIGMFSFSFNWNLMDTAIQLPVLPLGVWILMFAYRGKGEKWQVYRPFAWFGFFSLFLYILATLLTIPVNQVLYPKDELSTYIASVENASIITTHPSANERSLDKDLLANQIARMEQQTVHSDQWYQEMTRNIDTSEIEEQFPYHLIGSLPKRGSGVDAMIYVEKDGRGLLITAPNGQYYFRSDDSLFKEGDNE